MKRLHDVVIPLVTPLTESDEIDHESLKNLTEHLIQKRVNCLYPCGTTGEMSYFTDSERKAIVETVVQKTSGRIPVFAQVGAANTASTIELAKHAVACGADGIGVVTPWYFSLTDREIIAFYEDILAAVPSDYPVYLYAIPQNAVNDISYAAANYLADRYSNVVGIKYSYPDMTKLQNFMKVRDGDFDVLVGPDHLYEAVVAVGGKGVVSGNAMIIPEHYEAITKAMKDNDWIKATQVQRRTNMLNGILCAQNNIASYKVVLKHLGVIETSKMRKPMQQLPAEVQDNLLSSLLTERFNEVLI